MKKKIMIVTALAAAAAVYALLSFMGVGRQFIIKDQDIVAATADLNNIFYPEDSEEVFNVKVAEMTQYFTANGINTAIIHNKAIIFFFILKPPVVKYISIKIFHIIFIPLYYIIFFTAGQV